jgi:hypothetical protein
MALCWKKLLLQEVGKRHLPVNPLPLIDLGDELWILIT